MTHDEALAEALEAGYTQFCNHGKGSLCEHSPSHEKRAFEAGVKKAIDAADLVPRSRYDALLADFNSKVCAEIRAINERDEARQKLAEARSHWSKAERERDEARAQVKAQDERIEKLEAVVELVEDGNTGRSLDLALAALDGGGDDTK